MKQYEKIPDDIKDLVERGVQSGHPDYQFLKEQLTRCWPDLLPDVEYQARIYLADRCNLLNLRKQKEIKFLVYYLHTRSLTIQTRFKSWREINEGSIVAQLNNDNITVDHFYDWIVKKFEDASTSKFFGQNGRGPMHRPNNPNSNNNNDGTDTTDNIVKFPCSKTPMHDRK